MIIRTSEPTIVSFEIVSAETANKSSQIDVIPHVRRVCSRIRNDGVNFRPSLVAEGEDLRGVSVTDDRDYLYELSFEFVDAFQLRHRNLPRGRGKGRLLLSNHP